MGVDVIALEEYGGGIDDPVAAWIRAGRDVVLQVVAPHAWNDWSQDSKERFRRAVRDLAATHDLLGRDGDVTVLFDPPQTSIDDGTAPSGEAIERADR
jgi:hypothetical protein